jgi:hypothetical protein
MVMAQWFYHWFLCRRSKMPKLLDMRLYTCGTAPLWKGFGFATGSFLPAVVVVLVLTRGIIFDESNIGVKEALNSVWPCASGTPIDQCVYSPFDIIPSGYGSESAVTKTTRGRRRKARTGIALVVVGGYAAMATLKLMVIGRGSRYYRREEKPKSSTLGDLAGEGLVPGSAGGSVGSSEAQSFDDREEAIGKDDIAPIFVTHLWKRSTLALCMYVNAVMQQIVIQFSFSPQFQTNIQPFLLCLFLFRLLLKILYQNILCEQLLVIPLHAVNQVTYLVTLNASDGIFDFMVNYLLILGVQMIDRIYFGPMEEFVTAKVSTTFRSVTDFIQWVQTRRQAGMNDGDAGLSDDDDPTKQQDEDVVEPGEHDTEDMMSFCAGLATDAVGDLMTPMYFLLCQFLYRDSKILASYQVKYTDCKFYTIFYIVMLVFQTMINGISVNIAELYHGWHIVDYLEWCTYRFEAREKDWKAREVTCDEGISSQMRSLDHVGFNEQFYFIVILNSSGMLAWLFGMQTILANDWNPFKDPTTPIILFVCLCVCRGTHMMVVTSADYLKIWVVRKKDPLLAAKLGTGLTTLGTTAADQLRLGPAPPPPPPGSALEGWMEPQSTDVRGMERYRAAFLRENQVWLQATFSELRDQRMLLHQRDILLATLSDMLAEVPPERYAPDGDKEGAAAAGFGFGQVPQQSLAMAARELQRGDYKGSLCEKLIILWRERAQFMLQLQQVSQMVKISNPAMHDKCELCGRKDSLLTTPVQTLMVLASQYRIQRDMSPFWNMPLWRHFYQTFTATCTVCSYCNNKYYIQNRTIPVEEKRFKKFRMRPKGAADAMQENTKFGMALLDPGTVRILRFWQSWTKDLANGEHPRDFLPRYGFEGRTTAEIRKERQAKEAAEDEDHGPTYSDSEEEEKVVKKDPNAVNLGTEEEMRGNPFKGKEIRLTWASRALMLTWLGRVRQNLRAPQLSGWAHVGVDQLAALGGGGDGGAGSQAMPDLPEMPGGPTAAPGTAPTLPDPQGTNES